MTRIAAYVPDLMDRSKVGAVAPDVTFVPAPADLAAAVDSGVDLVVVDLSRPGVIDALSTLGDVRTIGFGSHVDRDLLAAATEAGCDEVLPRSRFFAGLRDLLA